MSDALPENDAAIADFFKPMIDQGLTIVDVGAQNLSTEEHVYHRLVQHDLVTEIIGFEPQAERASDRSASDPLARIIPEALGDGESHTLYCNNHSGTSSFYQINPDVMGVTHGLDWLKTVSTEEFATRCLDDLNFPECIDLMKLDTQGSETMILSHGIKTLGTTLSVYCEIMFRELYSGQPHPGDLLNSLTKQGFQLHDFYFPAKLSPASFKKAAPSANGSALFWADGLFFKENTSLDASKLVRQATLAHFLFDCHDLAFDLLTRAAELGMHQDTPKKYLDLLNLSD